MKRTTDFRPRTPSPLSQSDSSTSKGPTRPQSTKGSPSRNRRRERDDENPAGQQSMLARTASENAYVIRTGDALVKGTQPAAPAFADNYGFDMVKEGLLQSGYVVQHNEDPKKLVAVPVSRFVDPEFVKRAERRARSITVSQIEQQISRNARTVEGGLEHMVARAPLNKKPSAQEERVSDSALLVLNSLFEEPAKFVRDVSTDKGFRHLVLEAAHDIGAQLIYVPDREAPIAVERYDLVANAAELKTIE